jgi:hypothetical protein
MRTDPGFFERSQCVGEEVLGCDIHAVALPGIDIAWLPPTDEVFVALARGAGEKNCRGDCIFNTLRSSGNRQARASQDSAARSAIERRNVLIDEASLSEASARVVAVAEHGDTGRKLIIPGQGLGDVNGVGLCAPVRNQTGETLKYFERMLDGIQGELFANRARGVPQLGAKAQ